MDPVLQFKLNRDPLLDAKDAASVATLDEWTALCREGWTHTSQLHLLEYLGIDHTCMVSFDSLVACWHMRMLHDIHYAYMRGRKVRTSPLNPKKQADRDKQLARMQGLIALKALKTADTIGRVREHLRTRDGPVVAPPPPPEYDDHDDEPALKRARS